MKLKELFKNVNSIYIKQGGKNNSITIRVDNNSKSFQQYIDSSLIPRYLTKNRFSYRNPAIKFHGRSQEIKLIDDFMKCDSDFLLWSLTGAGGMGKSKFALYLSNKYKKMGWNVVWLDKSEIVKLLTIFDNYNYNKKTLFVFDYAGSFVKEIASFIELLFNTSNDTYTRFLLIERISYGYEKRSNVSWYDKLKYESDVIEEIEYSSRSLDLKHYPLKKQEYSLILNDFSHGKLKEYEKKEIIKFVENLKFTNNSQKVSQSNNRCLFLLFAADAYLDSCDLSHWNASDLMKRYINHHVKIIENKYSTSAIINGKILLSFATAMGGFDLNTDYEVVKENVERIKEELCYDNDISRTKSFLQDLSEKETDDLFVAPFIPDLIGEFLFLSVFSNLDEFIQTLWITKLLKEPYFFSFVEHCLSDWFDLDETQHLINSLLNSVNSEEESNLLFNIIVNSTSDLSGFEKIKILINKAQKLLHKYPTTKTARLYIRILVNAVYEASTYTEQIETIKNEALELYKKYKTYAIALEYATLLANISAKIETNLECIEQEQQELLFEYNTDDMADRYSNVLLNLSANSITSDEIEEIISKLPLQLHPTLDVELVHVKLLFNASCIATSKHTKERLIKEIDKIYNTYQVEDIAEYYISALVNLSADAEADDFTKIETISKPIYELFKTDTIAIQYATIILNKTGNNYNKDDIKSDISIIKELLVRHQSNELALKYAEILLNLSDIIAEEQGIVELIREIELILSEYDTEEIVCQYLSLFVNLTAYMTSSIKIGEIAEVFEQKYLLKYDNLETIEKYVSILVNQSAKTQDVKVIQEIISKAQNVLDNCNDEHVAAKFAEIYVNLCSITTELDEFNMILIRIENILIKYQTGEIACHYASAIANKTRLTSSSEEILCMAEDVYGLYNKYNSCSILVPYATILSNATLDMSTTEERWDTSKIIQKEAWNIYPCVEIALQLAKSLVNTASISDNMSIIYDVVKLFEDHLLPFSKQIDIVEQYAVALMLLADKSSDINEIKAISIGLQELLKDFPSYNIAQNYAAVLAIQVFELNVLEQQLEIIEILKNEVYDIFPSANTALCLATVYATTICNMDSVYGIRVWIKEIRRFKKKYRLKQFEQCYQEAKNNLKKISILKK